MNAFLRTITATHAAGLALAAIVAVAAAHMARYDVHDSNGSFYVLDRFKGTVEQCLAVPGFGRCWQVWPPVGG